MLARLARELPRDGYLYEPKWDGFRCLALRAGTSVDLRSRHDRPLARYFPELVEGLMGLSEQRFALDGEIVVARPEGFDFEALMSRLHPAASRVERLRADIPASLVAFDLLAAGPDDLRDGPFEERRRRLEALLAAARPPIHLTPLTDDPDRAAEWLGRFKGAGIDGVVAKHRSLPYESGKRAMVKVKRERTADCVLAGWRWTMDGDELGSLLLGLYDDAGELRHVGVVSQLSAERRRELREELATLEIPLEEHPWRQGFSIGRSPVGRLKGAAGRWVPGEMTMDWVPLRPARVCEVAYGQLDGDRFRFPAKLVRWRPDRDPRSCTIDQLRTAAPSPAELGLVPGR